MKQRTDKTGGFTIIEVVLVLAVAGLIFLVVFAAIPRLQASRRDNQRKRDAEAVLALVNTYLSNVDSTPLHTDMNTAFTDLAAGNTTSTSPFFDYIVNENISDPSGSGYVYDGSTNLLVTLRHLAR